jgi:hypothetical protein
MANAESEMNGSKPESKNRDRQEPFINTSGDWVVIDEKRSGKSEASRGYEACTRRLGKQKDGE